MKKEHEILFEPFKIGTVMIKNRFVLEPMEGTNMIDCLPIFKIGEDIHDYYVERAELQLAAKLNSLVLTVLTLMLTK
jgi:2-enoate reductase